MKRPKPEETVSVKEALEMLGVSRGTLHNRIASGDLVPLPKNPALKKRHRLEFRRADIEALIPKS